jgi:putative transposase
MPRALRDFTCGRIYHILNRGVHRQTLFSTDEEFQQFQRLIGRAQTRTEMQILAYCLMRNHWHFALWPQKEGAVSAFAHWLSGTHACHFNRSHDLVGQGSVYQGRFTSVTVRDERQLLTLLRYIESNPRRAHLVERAERWPWSSLTPSAFIRLTASPYPRPDNWLDLVNDEGVRPC